MSEVSGQVSEPRLRRNPPSPQKLPSDEAGTFDFWDVAPTLGADKFVNVEDGWDGENNQLDPLGIRMHCHSAHWRRM